MLTNDDSAAGESVPSMPDAHGHAALLLVESLIHGLLARSIITIGGQGADPTLNNANGSRPAGGAT